eukprot:m.38583 g.38583  ORF g.38583 m.38583 type:complete len:451 (+) comp5892_c0_seq1:80-1432(+)
MLRTKLLAPRAAGVACALRSRRLSHEGRLPVGFDDVARAHARIRGGITATPCTKSFFLSEICGMNVYVKREFQQLTGSFKERGARNALIALKSNGKIGDGVIAASAGNHALALAWHGSQLGVPVTVVMPTTAPLTKVNNCRLFGATVVLYGEHIGEAKDEAQTNAEYASLNYINGYDDPLIVAGAGTIGIEMCDQVPHLDAVVVPIGGAGLIAGVALAVKTLLPSTTVIGVEPEKCPSFTYAIERGEAKAIPNPQHTLADGLNVPCVGPTAFEVARHYVDKTVLVDEASLALAVLRIVEKEKCVVEGGGAAGLAAILPGGPVHEQLQGKTVVVPFCGGNIDTTVLGRVIERGLAADGRLVRFTATVSDRPGGIARLTALLAREGASLKDIYHERAWLHSSVDLVNVKCVIETSDADHSARIHDALLEAGYPINWGQARSGPKEAVHPPLY